MNMVETLLLFIRFSREGLWNQMTSQNIFSEGSDWIRSAQRIYSEKASW